MLYPFISFPNGTEIVHSEIYYENDIPVVRVEIENQTTNPDILKVCK